jgi:RimJ/RimL family protein N-acetyltransferase
MITGEHTIIRTAEGDDAYALKRLYDSPLPRAAFLDRRREISYPSVDELREGMGRPEKMGGALYVVEDRTGLIRGFCALRSAGPELGYGEVILPLFEEEDYADPLAEEALEYLVRLAFLERRMNKLLAHCLDSETAWRALLERHGFKSNGVQRDVLWTRGRYFDLETLTRFADGR